MWQVTSTLGAVGLGLAVALTGCGAAVSPDYTGDPLMTIQGVVENPDGLALAAGAKAQIVWLAAIGSGDATQLLASTTVQTALPADFAITLYTTPPPIAVAIDRRADAAVAYGAVVVVTDAQLDAMARGRPVRGVFAESDLVRLAWVPSAGDATALNQAAGSRLTVGAGFNLVTDDGEALDLAEVPISLTLRDGGQP